MKQIIVDKNCNGCGLCTINSKYLRENDEGNAEPIGGISIPDNELEMINNLIVECPQNALKIIETKTTNKHGRDGVLDIINKLKNQCNKFSVKKINNKDVRLNCKDYFIPIPRTTKQYKREYTSKSSAKSAAKDEFRRLCYSEAAYRPMIKKVFVEYKVNVLKPYYICSDTQESEYFIYNQEIRKLLSDAYAEIYDIMDGKIKIPESWKNFSVYFSDEDWDTYQLRSFDERSTCSGVITEFKSRGEYTSLNWYVNRLDYDYDEMYIGEGLFGKMKFKDMWYFSGFDEAAKDFVDDLKFAIDMVSSDIEDEAVEQVNYVLEVFEKKVKDVFNSKINELEKYI